MPSPQPQQSTKITLRSLEGSPLQHEPIERMVRATAEAIAERQGIVVRDIQTHPDRIEVTLDADRIVAIGFAAELRRLTTTWYCHKFGIDHLWGDPEHH